MTNEAQIIPVEFVHNVGFALNIFNTINRLFIKAYRYFQMAAFFRITIDI